MHLTRDMERNLALIGEKLGVGISFDALVRKFQVGGRDAALVFLDGMTKGWEIQRLIADLMAVERAQLAPNPVDKLIHRIVSWMEVDVVDTVDDAVEQVLAGPVVLLMDGVSHALVLDMREYPARTPEEPELERVTRGPRDGFVETLVFNTALIRRRLRDPRLRFELIPVGENAATDVVVAYLAGEADMALVQEVRDKIRASRATALTMGARSLLDAIVPSRLNPFPLARVTERPDVVAAHLLEGHVAVLVDTTPQVILLPANAWHFIQHAEEFFQAPIVGTYIRWVRLAGIAMSLVLGPLWLAVALTDRGNLPPWLAVIGPKGEPTVPLWAQFFLLEIGLDLLRIALIHTPTALATSLGIVGAILLGDLAVKVGLFVNEAILYAALVAIGYFSTPSMEFAYAIRLFRFVLLAAASLFRLPGIAGGTLLVLAVMAFTRSFGLPYLWPLIPFDGASLRTLLFRYPLPNLGAWSSRRSRPAAHPAPQPNPGS